jgi:hypothetical protein
LQKSEDPFVKAKALKTIVFGKKQLNWLIEAGTEFKLPFKNSSQIKTKVKQIE